MEDFVGYDCDWRTFRVEFPPTLVRSSQQKKIGMICGHPTLFTPKKTARCLKHLADALISAGIDELKPRAEAPVAVKIVLWYNAPKASLRGCWKTTKPDSDNLAKSILDCITKSNAVWVDDSQVCSLTVHKRFLEDKNETPHIDISFEYLAGRF